MQGKGMEEGDEDMWMLWLAYESKNSTFKGIQSRIYGIKHHFKLRFGFDPFKTDRFGVNRPFVRFERVFRQIKRMDKSRPQKKFSVTKFVLMRILKLVNVQNFDDLLVWVMIVVGVSCLLRWSELCQSGNSNQVSKLLVREDLSIAHNTMWLALKDTKTKLFGDPMIAEILKDNTKLCPYRWMKSWLAKRPVQSKWLFCDKEGKPIKAKMVQLKLRKWLNKLGYDLSKYEGGMSLRKGGALSMALCGVPDRVIRAYGRWKSFAYRTYIDLTEEEKQAWNKIMSEKISNSNDDICDFEQRATERNGRIISRLLE